MANGVKAFYHQVLIYGRERSVNLEASIHNPNCVLGNILAAHFLCSSDPSRAPSYLQASKSRLEGATSYERAFFNAINYLVSENRDDDTAVELHSKAIFSAGYKAMLHIHSVVEECEIIELIHQMDPKTRTPMKKKILFVNNGAVVLCRIQVNNLICIKKFLDFPQLGRFTLRTEGKTAAVGKIIELHLQVLALQQFRLRRDDE